MTGITFVKDPSAILDYKFDWSDWLSGGEVISNYEITIDPDEATELVEDSSSITDAGESVTVWMSGGLHNRAYAVACKIETDGNRTDERTMLIKVRNR